MKNLSWVLFSIRGFNNECCVMAFDNKEDAEEFASSHKYYAEVKTKTEALKSNDFGYYYYNGNKIEL